MNSSVSSKIRTVALVGHGAASKPRWPRAFSRPAAPSTAAVALSAAIPCLISIRSKRNSAIRCSPAIASLQWGGAQNTPDRHPGYPDFMGQAIGALAAVGAPCWWSMRRLALSWPPSACSVWLATADCAA